MIVAKVRRCTECKQIFATPESFRSHKRVGGDCRPVEALSATGFIQTPQGWRIVPPERRKK